MVLSTSFGISSFWELCVWTLLCIYFMHLELCIHVYMYKFNHKPTRKIRMVMYIRRLGLVCLHAYGREMLKGGHSMVVYYTLNALSLSLRIFFVVWVLIVWSGDTLQNPWFKPTENRSGLVLCVVANLVNKGGLSWIACVYINEFDSKMKVGRLSFFDKCIIGVIKLSYYVLVLTIQLKHPC